MALGASCLDEPDCYKLINNIVGVTYRVMGSGANARLTVDSVITDGVDSAFLQDFAGPTFILPLNMQTNEMTYTFQGLDKSMTIGYTVRPQFVSEGCTPRFVFEALEVIDHNFDSVRVVNSFPGTDNKAKNIEIFRCPVIETTVIGFYQLYSKTRSSEQVAIPITGIKTDFNTTTYFRNSSRREVTLPLNLKAKSTTFSFDFGNGSQNLVLSYDTIREARFSPCGEQTFISGLTIGSAMFDSVSIARDIDGVPQTSLSDPPIMNVKIFLCPQTNLVQIAFTAPATSGTGTVSKEVELLGIRNNFSADVFYKDSKVSTAVLPLNADADTTTFFIDYVDKTETLALEYSRSEVAIFPACTQIAISDLHEAVDLEDVTIKSDTLTFPPSTNIEILAQ